MSAIKRGKVREEIRKTYTQKTKRVQGENLLLHGSMKDKTKTASYQNDGKRKSVDLTKRRKSP